MACHNGKRKHRFIRYIVAGIITAYSIASLLYLHFAGDKYSERRDGRERSDVPIQNRSHDLKRTSYSLTVENLQDKINTSQEEETETLSRVNVPKTFLIEEADFCRRRPRLQVIAYVHSAISRVQERQETRSTWANATASGLGVDIAAVFMVGRAKDERERQIVQEESQRYHDIVQGDYDDDYHLLTYKGLTALAWIAEHCGRVPWTLHSDDDTFIDIFTYMERLKALDETSKDRFICNHKEEPVLRTGRWKVNEWEFPDAEYPTYCSGGVWFLRTKLVPRLLDACRIVPFLWVDDVYITGLLAQAANVSHFNGGGHCFEALKPADIGEMLVWFYPQMDRNIFWRILIDFHRKVPFSFVIV